MPNDKLKNYLHLHFLVFIAGFTAILGELITISAIPLVWYRMIIALVLIFIYIKIAKIKINIPKTDVVKLSLAGIIIALHWITFFASIEVSNISIALSMFSTGAFFASIIEPLVFKRKIIGYEIIFGLLVILGVIIITQSELKHLNGILLGIVSAFLSALFAVLNGKFLKKFTATTISFYEFLSGILFISILMFVFGYGYSSTIFHLPKSDITYLLLLGSICTAYAFIAAVHVMHYISPYTVMLTYNLEPVYGIILALLFFPENEQMSPTFYYGAAIILFSVLVNGILKNKKQMVKRKSS
ncbi:MAG TPA: DMT family transporter [Flavobacteriaceae bacterium]|nr:DMT family transporter [Flavobacteriaceae bacterium]